MRVTRRQFLFGALGIGLVAAGGDFGLHELLPNAPRNLPTDYRVDSKRGSFDSEFMRRHVNWRLSVPGRKPVAIVYCLHGKDGNANSVFDELRLPDFVAQLDLPLAIASVDGGSDSYYHARKDGTDALSMIIKEWIPLIERQTQTSTRALLGYSMGGYGGLLAAETYPQMFDATVAMSPALWTSSGQTAPGAFDSAADYEAHNVFARRNILSPTKVRISCGTSDPFYKATRAFVSELPAAQVDFEPGGHDADFWRGVAPAALNFIHDVVSS